MGWGQFGREGVARGMIRISTIFIAICMVLVAASLGLVLYSMAGISGMESAIVALTALTFLILYNAVSMRLRDRTDVGGQIADLRAAPPIWPARSPNSAAGSQPSRAGWCRRIPPARTASRTWSARSTNSACWSSNSRSRLRATRKCWRPAPRQPPPPPAPASAPTRTSELPFADDARPAVPPPKPCWPRLRYLPRRPRRPPPPRAACRSSSASIKTAVEENRLDIYLQPMVTLPQRKVRFYEAVTRLRDDKDQILAADDFIGVAEGAGLIGRIDHAVMLRCVQVLRRLMVRNKDVGVFCNVSAMTLGNPTSFAQCLDFLEANRALAPSFVLEFKQATFRNLGPAETENLAALSQRGYRFSIDHVTDLRVEPRELADRGVRFIKVPAALLLDPRQTSTSDIHPSDLSDLLGRFGIDLIAEKIEGERAVVDLLDYDVRFGQGFLFAPPRPLRPEGALLPAGPLQATRRKPMAPARRLQSKIRPSTRRRGRPAMPRWRAVPPGRTDRSSLS